MPDQFDRATNVFHGTLRTAGPEPALASEVIKTRAPASGSGGVLLAPPVATHLDSSERDSLARTS